MLGITVLADFILNEGVEAVLDNLVERAGATAVALNPTVTAPSEEGTGSFQPPSDAGSSPRLFDRPLWGRRSLWVRSAPSYHPRLSYYGDTPYKPRNPNELTDAHGELIGQFIDAALDRGLAVYLQLSGATPPGLTDDDRPRRPDGRLPDRMADTGCLASEAVRAYVAAHVRDLLEQYPRVTGFRPDWPEYPCYKLDEAFQDFNPQVARWAGENRFDYGAIREEVRAAYDYLHGRLQNRDLLDPGRPRTGRGHAGRSISFLSRHRGMAAPEIRPVQRPAAVLEDGRHDVRGTRKETFSQCVHVSAHPVDRLRFPWSAGNLRRGIPQALYHALVRHGGILGTGAAGPEPRPGRRPPGAVACPSLRSGR